jgi:hypothetical protein
LEVDQIQRQPSPTLHVFIQRSFPVPQLLAGSHPDIECVFVSSNTTFLLACVLKKLI